jgi:regulator of replication initiation timing
MTQSGCAHAPNRSYECVDCLVARANRLEETLTRCQEEGTRLVLENRELRARLNLDYETGLPVGIYKKLMEEK